MIYMESHQLGWKALKDSYMDTLPSSLTEEHRGLVRPLPSPLFPWLPAPCLGGLWAHLHLRIPGGKNGQGIPCLSAVVGLPGCLPIF